MRQPLRMVGIDLGASNGRAMLGRFDGERLTLSEAHRFPNDPVRAGGTLYWDVLRLLHEIREGLRRARLDGGAPASVAVDTWGVDFGLLDGAGRLLSNPVHYRDARTDGMMDFACRTLPREALYQQTGLAFMPFNTLFQLLAMRKTGDESLDRAKTLLFMPDLFAYFLSGERGAEYTIASTSQLSDPRTRGWNEDVLRAFGLPDILPPLREPGILRGCLPDDPATRVIACAGHDTASAVAAVPAEDDDFAYISSGTWSLLGAETDAPVVTPEALDAGYTNEGGVGGKTRLLKNIMGLWILQECRRTWLSEGACEDFAGLARLAGESAPFRSLFDPDDARFLPPGDMPARIRDYCRETGQPAPRTRGEVARAVYESLALKYRWAVGRLERDLLGRAVGRLHVVGGGSNNRLLNEMTASALQKPVLAGPGEATAIGNLLVQAMALGELSGLSDIRRAARLSFAPEVFLPGPVAPWDDAYGRFLRVAGLSA